jgi:hypothetical protein
MGLALAEGRKGIGKALVVDIPRQPADVQLELVNGTCFRTTCLPMPRKV